MFGKLDRSKCPQELMLKYVNSKAEICENPDLSLRTILC